MTLVTGCYERFIFGLEPPQAAAKDRLLTKSFAYPGHQGAVKCITAGGNFIVSGGADDQLHIYDVQAQKDLGFLMNPGEGPVTAVELYVPPNTAVATHLFSGGADGTFAVWSAGPAWDCLKVMTGHHKEITGLSVHPSGKLALSTSRDSTLRIWDLVKGRCSYHNILPTVADGVSFSPDGALYALLTGNQVTIHNIGEEEGLVATLQHSQRVLCMAWYTNRTLLTGSENGNVHIWDSQAGKETGVCKQAHKTRIRGLVIIPRTGAGAPLQFGSESVQDAPSSGVHSEQAAEPKLTHQEAQQSRVASAASDGSVKVWRIENEAGSDCLQPVGEIQTGARLTCLCLVKPAQDSADTAKALAALKAKKRKATSLAKQKKLAAPAVVKTNLKKPKKQQTIVASAKAVVKNDVEKVGIVHDGVVDFTAVPGMTDKKHQKSGSKQPQKKQKRRQ